MVTCLVTIHGIGFQQFPDPSKGLNGYADKLHQNLLKVKNLENILGGDNDPKGSRTNDSGPIYVSSHWPPNEMSTELGVGRLGKWRQDEKKHRELDISNADIIDRSRPISHIALVYSRLADQGPHPGSTAETIMKALFSAGNYVTLGSVAHAIFQLGAGTISGLLKHSPSDSNEEAPSLQVRQEVTRVKPEDRGDFWTVIKQLEQDVATYVCRNDLRERVRSFVYEAIVRLCYRPDVEKVIINAHSQGTVLAFDILRNLPPLALEKVSFLVTAGSPLRKYCDLFNWGEDAGCIININWDNFWDAQDPVADPLVPGKSWHRDDPLPDPYPDYSDLFQAFNSETGEKLKVAIKDIKVDNAGQGVGGGLAAHNYWDNEAQFIGPLAELLMGVANL